MHLKNNLNNLYLLAFKNITLYKYLKINYLGSLLANILRIG